MTLAADHPKRPPKPSGSRGGLHGWAMRLVARPGFQRWAARFPLTRGLARRDGADLFDLVQGFVQSQVLYALVALEIPESLADGPRLTADIARAVRLPPHRAEVLINAAVALGLLRRHRGGRIGLARKGAALLGVPGLRQMILHHDVLYRDLADPVAFFRGETETELADFWPYVFGAAGAIDPDVTATYSDLMADSQGLVADDTLSAVSLRGVSHLMDVGGGSGAFAIAAARRNPDLRITLVDLPPVAKPAMARIAKAGLSDRITFHPASFRDDSLPAGVDAVSLVRVLYDHQDATVAALLNKVHDSLLPGGRLLISEPMSGGATPDRTGDVYFSVYTMAMRTGQTRSAEAIGALCKAAGFAEISHKRPKRPFVTSVLTAVRADRQANP